MTSIKLDIKKLLGYVETASTCRPDNGTIKQAGAKVGDKGDGQAKLAGAKVGEKN